LRNIHDAISLHVEVVFTSKVRAELLLGDLSPAISAVVLIPSVVLHCVLIVFHRPLLLCRVLIATFIALLVPLFFLRPVRFRLSLTIFLTTGIRRLIPLTLIGPGSLLFGLCLFVLFAAVVLFRFVVIF
jgi:hypothetical protein